MNIHLKNCGGYLRMYYSSKYVQGSEPVNNIEDLMHVIEEICGKGSYCLYTGKNDRPKTINFSLYEKYEGKWPQLTHWQDAVKTEVIEQARIVAREVWGNIPELEIGWLEDKLRAYVEDIEE